MPLIPVSIAAVQTWAKKLLAKYWGQYTALGDTFLENLQGLTTLKIYQADGFKQEEMNDEAEKFRRITMKVLTMQLNSITVMDLIAYGGAALGVILASSQFRAGAVSLSGCLLIILLSADYFIPSIRVQRRGDQRDSDSAAAGDSGSRGSLVRHAAYGTGRCSLCGNKNETVYRTVSEKQAVKPVWAGASVCQSAPAFLPRFSLPMFFSVQSVV